MSAEGQPSLCLRRKGGGNAVALVLAVRTIEQSKRWRWTRGASAPGAAAATETDAVLTTSTLRARREGRNTGGGQRVEPSAESDLSDFGCFKMPNSRKREFGRKRGEVTRCIGVAKTSMTEI